VSAFVLVIDVSLAAFVLRFVLPMLDEQTGTLVIVIGLVTIVWKWSRDFG
jgi:hypothetical protein